MSIYNTAVNKPISTLMVFLAIMVLGMPDLTARQAASTVTLGRDS